MELEENGARKRLNRQCVINNILVVILFHALGIHLNNCTTERKVQDFVRKCRFSEKLTLHSR